MKLQKFKICEKTDVKCIETAKTHYNTLINENSSNEDCLGSDKKCLDKYVEMYFNKSTYAKGALIMEKTFGKPSLYTIMSFAFYRQKYEENLSKLFKLPNPSLRKSIKFDNHNIEEVN